MMQILGYVFLSILIAIGVVIGDYYLPGTFLTSFLDDHFIETFSGLVGFNIAAVIFLLGQLISLEERSTNKNAFENTKKEIKHNSYFLLISFLVSIIVLIFRPDIVSWDSSLLANKAYYIMNGLVVVLFCLAMASIFEILSAVFKLSKVFGGK